MGPAHYAREVRRLDGAGRWIAARFNEARALCAGSSGSTSGAPSSANGFNEARALCAGSFHSRAGAGAHHVPLQ